MTYFIYHQNNSGGVFTGPAVSVIVAADTAADANVKAAAAGIYFDGAGDCRCCGDRWYAYSDDFVVDGWRVFATLDDVQKHIDDKDSDDWSDTFYGYQQRWLFV